MSAIQARRADKSHAGMPSSAIATGQADYVLAPAAMPKQLVAYARGPYLQGAAVAEELPTLPAEPMQNIFVLLRSRTGAYLELSEGQPRSNVLEMAREG